MGDPQVTMGFNTKSWSNDWDDLGVPLWLRRPPILFKQNSAPTLCDVCSMILHDIFGTHKLYLPVSTHLYILFLDFQAFGRHHLQTWAEWIAAGRTYRTAEGGNLNLKHHLDNETHIPLTCEAMQFTDIYLSIHIHSISCVSTNIYIYIIYIYISI